MSDSTDKNPYKVNTGLYRVWRATVYSYSGLLQAFRLESAFRQELAEFLLTADGASRDELPDHGLAFAFGHGRSGVERQS